MDHKKMGVWMPPGGHQEKDENPIEAAIRETLEETGINISAYLPKQKQIDAVAHTIPKPDYFLEEKISEFEGQPEHFHLDHVYVVKIPFQQPVNSDMESHSIGWFSLKDISSKPLLKNVELIISEILQ
jgi:8-oxo-dGTP pyrophosphatase MutT (NUDIX family)